MKFLNIILLLLISININAKDINFDKLVKNANEQNKQVMIFFHMEHCPWCHQMIDISLNKKDVMNTINKYFIYTDMDVETSGGVIYKNETISKRTFARKFRIYFYPTTLMFDNGDVVENIRGYRNKTKFTNVIKYIGSKSQNKMTLKEFIANEDFESEI